MIQEIGPPPRTVPGDIVLLRLYFSFGHSFAVLHKIYYFCQNQPSNSYINCRADLKLFAAPLLCPGDLKADQSIGFYKTMDRFSLSSVCYFLLDKMVRALHYRRESTEEKVKNY